MPIVPRLDSFYPMPSRKLLENFRSIAVIKHTATSMNYKSDQRLMSLHNAILAERESLIARLRQVDEALAAMGVTTTQRIYGMQTPSGRARNKQSLKKTVLQVLSGKSMTKNEVLDAVLRTGYQFSTDDPLNSLGVILYGKNPKFKNNHGRFTV